MEPLIEILTHYGLPGVMLAVMLVLYVKKDQDLSREKNARIKDATDFREVSLKLQERVIESVTILKEVFDELRKATRR